MTQMERKRMNEYALYHRGESEYAYAHSKSEVTLRLRVDRNDSIDAVRVVYGGKYDFYGTQFRKEMMLRYVDRLFAYYEVTLRLKDVRLTYVFEIVEDGKVWFFSEDGLTETYNFALNFYNCFQFPYINDSSVIETVPYLQKTVFYEIFVDRFARGDKKKDDSYITMKWNEKPTPKSFAGGDLEGIIKKIPYLKRLGVNGIYLTPIFTSVSNHKYDISDYYEIDPHFGTKETLRTLVKKAHEAGMKILLDAVFNHVSENHPFFQDVKKNGERSPYFHYFKSKNGKFECFSSCQYMPKWDTDNPEVQDYLIGIGKHYIEEYDIDGWRLDVSDEVSHPFWKRFRKETKAVKKEVVLIGENWHDAHPFLEGDEFDSIMNYAFTKAMLDFLAFDTLDERGTSDRLNSLLVRNADPVNLMMLNLLDSHDTNRFFTEVGKNLDRYLIGLAILFFFEGVPCLYYGDEALMEGGYDPDSRRGFRPNTNNEAYRLIRFLSRMRKRSDFAFSRLRVSFANGLLLLERFGKDSDYVLAVKKGEGEVAYSASEVLWSNHYESGTLKPCGFVVERRKK